ncbi:P-loop containing nucleoside triphosphate hydrolase protein [Mycena pura]|uniref:ATP-dependent DNA helicase n=1 Tax=Mycena pura TaxID=153505 RepID=A0AAD6VVB6_9AGAR|nr:P-loop containing nucleoside triphosphate hydrolase protein [Mycena pura]
MWVDIPDSEEPLWEPPDDETLENAEVLDAVNARYGGVLERVFGLKSFRPNQAQAISKTMDGQDVLVLMPTGSGKSLCYQLPAVVESESENKITIVISPLLALINDQVQALTAKGIYAETDLTHDMLAGKRPALVYMTPEKLAYASTLHHFYQARALARFAVDEAHCISIWGAEFRETYRKLDVLRRDFPGVPIMALTSTATSKNLADIINHLGLRSPHEIRQSLNRQNLTYAILQKRPHEALKDIVKFITNKGLLSRSGIIYRTKRRQCENLAKLLRKRGIAAAAYHGGMPTAKRNLVQSKWMRGQYRVIVATIAFGMGVDKADVRYVVHFDLPRSIENYYQETGRAGRDGKPAECILYYSYRDLKGILDLAQKDNSSVASYLAVRRSTMEMVQYCEEKAQCRRRLLLAHFGENLTEDRCDTSSCCTNCANAKLCVTKDMACEARAAVALFRSLMGEGNITVNQLISVFRALKNVDTRKNGRNKKALYGAGKHLSQERAELLFDQLLYRRVFEEIKIATVISRYGAYYLKVVSFLNLPVRHNADTQLRTVVGSESRRAS